MIEDSKQKIPCGGFYIGEGLELDDATKTLKSVGGGGGLSLVGGGGINITWDGSTEGRDVISLEAAGANLYKVSNSVFDNSELIDSVFSYTAFGQGTTVTLDENPITEFGANCYGINGIIAISGVAGEYSAEVEEGIMNFTIPSDGTYFLYVPTPSGDMMATSITKTGTAKLMQNGEDVTDEVKEAVGGGGATVVTFTIATDGDTQTLTADMTPAQVLTAMESSPVVGVLAGEDEGVSFRIPFGGANPLFASGDMTQPSVIFTSYSSSAGELRAFLVIVGDTETGWSAGL